MSRRVNMVRPDGSVVSVAAEDVAKLEGLGYRGERGGEVLERLSSEQESVDYSGWDQEAITALEGGLSGATLGASDLFLNGRGSRLRAAYHPMARMGGEIVGALVPAFATGGESLEVSAAELGTEAVERGLLKTALAEATPAGRLAGVGARVSEAAGGGLRGAMASGAVEGAVYGAAGEVSHAELSGDPVTAEHVLAGAGLGTLFGVGGAGVLHGLSTAGSRALRAVMGGADNAIERATSEELDRTLANLSASGVDHEYVPLPAQVTEARDAAWRESISHVSPRPAPDVASSVLPPEHYAPFYETVKDVRRAAREAMTAADEAHRQAERAARQAALTPVEDLARTTVERGNEVTKAAFTQGENIVPATKAFKRLQAAQSKGSEAIREALKTYRVSIGELADKIGAAWNPPELNAEIAGDIVARQKAAAELAPLASLDVPSTPSEFLAMDRDTAERVVGSVGRFLQSPVPEVAGVKGALTASIDRLAEAIGVTADGSPVAKLRAAWKVGNQARAKRLWGALDAAEAEERSKAASYGKRLWKEQTAREEASKGLKWSGQGPGNAGPKPGDPVAEHHTGGGMVRRLARTLAGGLAARTAGKLGLGTAARLGAYGLAGYAIDGQQGLLAGLVAARAKSLKTLTEAVERWGPRAGRVLRAGAVREEYLRRSLSGIEDPQGDLRARYRATTDELRNLAYSGRDRAFMASQALTAQGLAGAAPALYGAATNALDRLVERIPKKPLDTAWGFDDAYEPPPEVVRVFAEVHQALATPLDFVNRAVDDPQSIHPAAAQAFKEGWPALWSDLRARMIPVLSDRRKELRAGDLRAWSVILDVPLTPVMTPEFVAAQAQMFMSRPAVKPMPDQEGGQSEPATPGQQRS